MYKNILKYTLYLLVLTIFPACSSIPNGVNAVKSFEKEKFLGKWYEIARFDYKYEKGINNNTAVYSLRTDGMIRVVNRGYNYSKNKWEEVEGKAKFVRSDKIGMLEVSFFGPFYSGYNVIAIDNEYNYALIAGKSLKYLWILSREKTIPKDIKSSYLNTAKEYGFETSELVWIEHNK